MDGSNSATQQRLLSIVHRIENLEEEKRSIADLIREVKQEAKSAGFDVKVVNQMLKERRMDAAERKRLMPETAPPEGDSQDDEQPPPPATIDPATLDEAREKGREAARAGERIVDNPYLSDDPRRAAWDEGWCAETGSDGMEIPPAWRRSKPKKSGSGPAPSSEGGETGGGDDGKEAG